MLSDPKPYGSIIERFRGTEWEAPKPPPSPPPGRRGPLAVLLLITIIAAGGIGFAIIRQGVAPQQNPSAGPARPGVTPRVPDSIRILDAFWSTVRQSDLAYHLEGSGTAHATTPTQTFDTSFELSLDVVGDEFSGRVNSIGGSGMAEITRVDGVVYARPQGGNWVYGRTSDSIVRQDPFAGLEGRRELGYDSAVVVDGGTLHRLSTTEFYAPSVGRMLDLASFNFHANVVKLDLLVTDAGIPVSATFTCLVNGSLADGIPHFVGSAEYTYTKFGEPADIKAPIGLPS